MTKKAAREMTNEMLLIYEMTNEMLLIYLCKNYYVGTKGAEKITKIISDELENRGIINSETFMTEWKK